MEQGRIRHMVVFCLHGGREGAEAEAFLRDGETILAAIPAVEKFEALRQVSPKNDYDFGFSMEFADQAAYDAYNAHPAHVAFVKERWEKQVSKFLEIDLAAAQ